MDLKRLIAKRLPLYEAEAHCDIPCGIYDPIAAKIAAQTVLKMVMRIQSLGDPGASVAALNSASRYVTVKEEHAELTKHELDILWHDYFKPEHLEKYPDLHTTFWNATKLASANKQGRLGRQDRRDLLGDQGGRVQRPGRRGAFRHVAADALGSIVQAPANAGACTVLAAT